MCKKAFVFNYQDYYRERKSKRDRQTERIKFKKLHFKASKILRRLLI